MSINPTTTPWRGWAGSWLVLLLLVVGPAAAGPPSEAGTAIDADWARGLVAASLIKQGRPAEDALAAAAALTEADLEVLARNPDMLQAAGSLDRGAWTLIIGLALIALIVLIASSGDGSVSINL